MSMHKSINIIHKAALAVLALVLAAGCIAEKDSTSMDTKGVMVQLNVSAGQMQTKAMDESAIKTIRVFAFDQNGKQVGHIYDSSIAADETMHMMLSVSAEQPTAVVDFYAVANEAAMYYDGLPVSLSENMTKEELDRIVYSSLMTTEEVLPLYGKIEDKTLTLTSDLHSADGHYALKIQETVAVQLYRSLAKIGFYAAAVEGTSSDPVIHSITLKAPGRRNVSYLFPAADLQARDASVVSLSEDRVFDNVVDGKDMLSNAGVITKRLSSQNTDAAAVVTDYYTEILSPFFLAEVPYGSTSWDTAADASKRPVELVVEYSHGEGTIRKYAAVNMPAIERNNFYQVRCLIKSEGQIMVDVSVNPWEAGEDWDISFDFPTHSDPLLATGSYDSSTGYADHVYGTEATMYHTGSDDTPGEGGAFCVDFNMSYPVGGSWQPMIGDASNADFELRLYKRGDVAEITDHKVFVTSENTDQWYTIKVVPLKSDNVGKKVTLSVSYTPIYLDGGYSYLLQVNGGEENDLAWNEKNPVEGDEYEASTVDIVITQIDTQ